MTTVPLTPLEIASGLVGGEGVRPPDNVRLKGSDPSPRAALERCILAALERPPCLVTFSGGRDSSLMLAVAASLARREGLDPPVPVTSVFPASPESGEEEWQRLVLDHVGLENWERLELGDELELLGPVARPLLRRHGVLFPWNAYSQRPALELARGGTVLTGWGGDELFAVRPFGTMLQPLRIGRRPHAGDLRRLLLWSVPRAPRRALLARFGMRGALAWLTPAARRRALGVWANEYAEEPRDWRRRVPWLARRRYLALGRLSLDLVAADTGAAISHPLWDPGFLAAAARRWGPLGPASRTEVMRDLAADLLPDEVLGRRSKARYGDTFIGPATREFARTYDGSGLDRSLVDPDALRRAWGSDAGLLASGSLVQALWLASGSGGDGGE